VTIVCDRTGVTRSARELDYPLFVHLICVWLAVADAGTGVTRLPPSLLSPPPAAAPRSTYRLVRERSGGYRYEGPRFTAEIAPDGTVTFKRRRSSGAPVRLLLPIPIPPPPTPVNPEGPDPAPRTRAGSRPLPGVLATPPQLPRPSTLDRPRDPRDEPIRPFGQVDGPTVPGVYVAVVGVGQFDLVDDLMGKVGGDSNGREKAEFLAATSELRARMAARERIRNLKRALADLPAALEAVWRDTEFVARERRRILYQIWHECDDSSAGREAAAIVEEFVRRRLPAGSSDAYTPTELRDFAPDGSRRFDPYAQQPAPTP
jgi:hypothetical protein